MTVSVSDEVARVTAGRAAQLGAPRRSELTRAKALGCACRCKAGGRSCYKARALTGAGEEESYRYRDGDEQATGGGGSKTNVSTDEANGGYGSDKRGAEEAERRNQAVRREGSLGSDGVSEGVK